MTGDSNFVFRWEIDNAAARLATGRVESRVFEEGGFRWTAVIERHARQPHDTVDFILCCDVDNNRPWKCDTEVDLYILHSDGRMIGPFIKSGFCFDENNRKWQEENFMNWSNISSPSYLFNDKVTLQYTINIISSEKSEPISDPEKFAVPNNRSDVTLLIGEKRLHVSKEFLALHSPVFEALFFGEFAEKGKDEVEIKDVVYEEFSDLLHVIYPGRILITDATVLHVLALGDRFQMERVLLLCEVHLQSSKKFTTTEKLRLADTYRLAELRASCLREYKTVREIGALKSSPEYDGYSADMKAAICDRVMNLIAEMD